MKNSFRKITVLVISVMITAAAGCKKANSDEEGYGIEIYGTAAVGSPVTGTIYIKDTCGKVSQSPIRSDGTYTVDVTALVAPFILLVDGHVGTANVSLYSTIDIPGRANVTPATNLILALALKNDPSTEYPPADVKADGKVIDQPPAQTDIVAARAKVQAILQNVFSVLNVPAGFDIMNGSFIADGSGFDHLLDLIKMDVEKDATGNVIANVSDVLTGITFYTEDAKTGKVFTDITDKMENAVAEAAADQIKIIALANSWKTYIMSTSKTEKQTILEDIYAWDYLNEGKNKIDSISEEIANNNVPEGLTSVTITNVSILGSVEDIPFTGGTLTTAGDRTYNSKNGSVTIPKDTVFTFNYGTLSSLKLTNYKAVKILTTITADFSGKTEVFTEYDYVVQQFQNGPWKFWGDRSLAQSEFNTTNKRVIYASYNDTTKTYSDKDIKFSGYNLWFNDEGNRVMDFGANHYGLTINAVLVTGQGMLRSFTDDGKKGMLLVRFGPNTDYTLVNNVVDIDGISGNYCISGRDLDLSQITSTELTVIAMHYDYDGIKNTYAFIPLYAWKCNENSTIPKAESELADNLFPSFANLNSTDIDNYPAFFSFPWNLPLNWNAPTASGTGSLTFGSLDCWFGGIAADGVSWTNNDSSDGDLIRNDSGTLTPTSYTFTMDYGVTGGTLVRDLRNINFSLRYGDFSVENGAQYETEYRINKQGPSAAINGTVTGVPYVAGKSYAVIADNDTDLTNGFVKYTYSSTDDTGAINYSITDVPAGTFYVYCIVYNTYNGSYPVSAITGDYTGYYVNSVTVPEKGAVSCNFVVSEIP